MVKRVTVLLSDTERRALDYLARLSLRAPDEQLRWLLREELLRKELISMSAPLSCEQDAFRLQEEVFALGGGGSDER